MLDGIDSIRVFYSSTSPKFVYLLSVLTTIGVQPKSTDWALRPYFRIHSRIFAFILFHHILAWTKRWFDEWWYNSQGSQHSGIFLDDLQENIASWNRISWLNASGWSKTLVFMGAFGEDKTRGTSRSNPPKSKATKIEKSHLELKSLGRRPKQSVRMRIVKATTWKEVWLWVQQKYLESIFKALGKLLNTFLN